MKREFWLFFGLLIFLNVQKSFGQAVSDNFNQNQFFSQSIWKGDTTSFVFSNQKMQSNNGVANATFGLFAQQNKAFQHSWLSWIQLTFNTSSTNYLDFFLMADTNVVSQIKNGYFVRLGGTPDEISLYKLVNSVETKIIDGVDGILNTSSNTIQLEILLNSSNQFTLKRQHNSSAWLTEGQFTESNLTFFKYTGFRIRQSTASFFNRHFIDDFYSGKVITDTIPPKILKSNIFSSNQVKIEFNEWCDSLTLKNQNNYLWLENQTTPSQILLLNSKEIELTFAINFPENIDFNIEVKGVKDTSDNVIQTDTILLNLYVPPPPPDFVADDFDTTKYFFNSIWKGDTSSFIFSNKKLQSNNSVNNAGFVIFAKQYPRNHHLWKCDIQIDFNPSSTNYVDFFIMADTNELQFVENGYFVRLGGTADEISLFKLINSVETKIIDGVDGILNISNNIVSVEVELMPNNVFYLKRKHNSSEWFSEGQFFENNLKRYRHSGFRVRQSTSSFFNKHFFDNFYSGKIIKDTIPPKILKSNIFSSNQVKIEFNEWCDSLTLKNQNNYLWLENQTTPSQILLLNSKEIELTFANNFPENIDFNIEVKGVKDTSGNEMKMDTIKFFNSVSFSPQKGDLIISEIMADPDPAVGLENKEYIEIWNISNKYISLKEVIVSDLNSSKKLPDFILKPDSFYVLFSPPSLTNSGKTIVLLNPQNQELHRVSYTDIWYQDAIKSQGGFSLELIDKNYPCLGSENWIASKNLKGGTPGEINSVNGNLNISNINLTLISAQPDENGLITLTFSHQIDSLMLLNSTLLANGNICNFSILSQNLTFTTFIIDPQIKTSKQNFIEYKLEGIFNCVNKNSKFSFKLMLPSEIKKGDILINEILFNPRTGGSDFVEIYNNTNIAFDLKDLFFVKYDNNGNISIAERISTKNLILFPYQYAIISSNPENICQFYTCKNSEALLIKMSNMLSFSDNEDQVILKTINSLTIDSLWYSNKWHSPFIKDDNGVSLERISLTQATHLKHNWHSASSYENYATPGYKNSQSNEIDSLTEKKKFFNLINKTVSPDADGFEDVLPISYKLPENGFSATIKIYSSNGVLIKNLSNNELLGIEGIINWDGSNDDGQICHTGIYIIAIECVGSNGKIIKEKMSCVVAYKF